MLNLKNEFGMKSLLACCPNCDSASLYCGKIPTTIKDMANKEVLFCKTCKLVVPVEEFKEILSSV
jgi:transcription elongation factor Elf1